MPKNKILKNTIYYSVGEIFPRIISFIMLPIYTRYLSPSDYGIIAYTSTIVSFLYVLGSFSLNSYVLRFYFDYENVSDQKKIIGTAHSFIILLNLLILFLAFLCMPSLVSTFNLQIPWEPFFKMAFITNFLDSISIIPMVVYRVRRDAFKFMVLGLSKSIVAVVLTVYFVIYCNMGVLGNYWALLYCNLFFSIIYLLVIKQHAYYTIKFKFLKEGLKFSAPLLPGAICYMLLTISDRIILERNVCIADLGIYNVACTMALALNIVVQSGYKSIEPEVFRRYGSADFYSFTQRAKNIYFCAIFVFAMIISLFSQEVFTIMTSEGFHKGYYLVPALIIGGVMTGQNVIYGCVLQCEKRSKIIGLSTLLGAAISIITNILLVPVWGVYAAAFASAISFSAMNAFLFYSMTFPNKTMKHETIIVLLLLLISYGVFYLCKEVSILLLFFKLLLVGVFMALVSKMLGVDMKTVTSTILKRK